LVALNADSCCSTCAFEALLVTFVLPGVARMLTLSVKSPVPPEVSRANSFPPAAKMLLICGPSFASSGLFADSVSMS
jgi:hypothetical protein